MYISILKITQLITMAAVISYLENIIIKSYNFLTFIFRLVSKYHYDLDSLLYKNVL